MLSTNGITITDQTAKKNAPFPSAWAIFGNNKLIISISFGV
jgi:hypothetical protein